MDELEKILEEAKKDAVDQSHAIARILLDMRKSDREEMRRAIEAANSTRKDRRFTLILCVIALIACLSTGAFLGILASGVQIETTTRTTTQDVEGDSATINNVDGQQYNDNAVNGGAE